MLNNYPIKKQHQHEPLEYEEMEDLNIPYDLFDTNTFSTTVQDVETYMSNSLYEMRRDFKNNAKKLLKLYSTRKPKTSEYKYAKSPKMSLSKLHVVKTRATA